MEKAQTRASESDPEDWITNILFELKLKGLLGFVKQKESEQKERVEGSSQSVRGPEATRGHPDRLQCHRLGDDLGVDGLEGPAGPRPFNAVYADFTLFSSRDSTWLKSSKWRSDMITLAGE